MILCACVECLYFTDVLPTFFIVLLLFALKYKYICISTSDEAVWTGKIMCSSLSCESKGLKFHFWCDHLKVFKNDVLISQVCG